MFFNSFVFLVFLAVVLTGCRALPWRRPRVAFLLAARYFLYGYWGWRFTGLVAISTVVDFTVGRGVGRTEDARARRRWLGVSPAVNLLGPTCLRDGRRKTSFST